jgi:acetyl-CoA synthetase
MGLALPPLEAATGDRLRALLPDAATVGNPLDYTALIWGEADTLRDIVVTAGADPGIDQLLVLYDQPAGIEGASSDSWAAVRAGILAGAAGSSVPVAVASTLPELLDDEAAARFAAAGIPAIAGLRTGLECVAALRQPPADPARLREIGAAAGRRRPARADNGSGWLAEHEAKQLLRDAGLAVVDGRLVAGEDDAVAALAELGGPVALKLSAPGLLHKSELGGLALDLRTDGDVRAAHRRLVALGVDGAAVLAEHMSPPGVELLVGARTHGVVPALIVGMGGLWTEAYDDVAIVPLPATPQRVESALRSLRAAGALTGGRGSAPVELAAVAALAAGVGALLRDRDLELIELNPVLVHASGPIAVDAVAQVSSALKRRAT